MLIAWPLSLLVVGMGSAFCSTTSVEVGGDRPECMIALPGRFVLVKQLVDGRHAGRVCWANGFRPANIRSDRSLNTAYRALRRTGHSEAWILGYWRMDDRSLALSLKVKNGPRIVITEPGHWQQRRPVLCKMRR